VDRTRPGINNRR